jgi:hypothetical protein
MTDALLFSARVHVLFPVQAPPQPAKLEPLVGVAVKLT